MLTHAFVSAPAQGPPWQGQIQNSPSEGAPTPRGHQHTRFPQKVHEIKKILVEGRAGGASLDPTLDRDSHWQFSKYFELNPTCALVPSPAHLTAQRLHITVQRLKDKSNQDALIIKSVNLGTRSQGYSLTLFRC